MAKRVQTKEIDCGGSSAIGIKTALSKLFDDMDDLRQAALKWKDPEGVHDMRVASRRLRSAISDFMPYVHKRELTDTIKQIKSIADALGEVRDQDVAIPALEKLASEWPSKADKTLEALIDTRKEARKVARQELKDAIVKAKLKEVRSDFDAAVTGATAPRQSSRKSSKSSPSYLEMAKAIIQDRLSDLEELSDSFYRPLQIDELHEMRIAAKRLRYAIELFQECLDPSVLKFAKAASQLQSSLGRVHDCDMWIESFGKEIVSSKKSSQPEQSATFVWLFNHFMELRHKHFHEAFSRWNEWATEDLSEKLKEALK